MRVRIIIIFFLTFGAIKGWAQDPFFYIFNKSKGVPSTVIYDAFIDSKGFTWFGTASGITRYDGNIFQKFETNTTIVNSCSNINEDILQRIWFQDFSGKIFYIEDDTIRFFNKSQANGFLRFKFLKDRLFIVSKQGIEIYNIFDFELIKSFDYPVKTVKQTIANDHKFYLIGDYITTVSYSGIVQNLTLPKNYKEIIKAPVATEYNDELFLFSKFGKAYYRIKDNEFIKETLPFEIDFIQNASVINNELWICSTNGLYRYNLTTKKHNHYFREYNVSCLISTKYNQTWVCTLNEGLLFIENLNSILFKTNTEAVKLDKKNNDVYLSNMKDEIFKLKNNNLESIYKGGARHAVYQLHIDSATNTIFFTSSKFQILSPTRKHTSVYPVKKIIKLDDKYFAYASSMGNGVLYINKNIQSKYDSIFLKKDEVIEDGIHFISLLENEAGKGCLFNEKEQTIYFITNYGLRTYKNDRIEEIPVDNIGLHSIDCLNEVIYCFSSDRKIYYLENKKLQLLQLPPAIDENNIQLFKVLGDKLCILSESAVFEYDPLSKKTKKIIEISDGGDLNDLELINNNYYLATYDGVIKVEKKNQETPAFIELFINKILANDKSKSALELLQLKPQDNNVEIQFSILSSNPNTKYKLSYRINNQRWEDIDNTSRSIKFSSLASGIYNIEIKVLLDQQAVVKSVQLNITDPFWSTWWFTIIVFCIFAVLLYLLYRFQIKRIYRKNRRELEKIALEKNLNQSKLKAIKSQMNPHFFFNALSTLQSYILSNDKRQAVTYLSRFSQLTRTFLEMSDKDFITLSEEINTLELYLEIEKGRFNDDFEYAINMNKSISNPDDIRIPSVLLQPYVENAIKHGLLHTQGTKKLTISFTLDNQYLTVVISDNGIGRKRSEELNKIRNKSHNSFATAAMDRRINLLNSFNDQKISIEYIDKYDDLNQASGTKVIINIPINH